MPLVAGFLGAFFHPWLVKGLPPEAADAIVGEYAPTQWSPFLETEVSERFVEAFNKKYGYTPEESESSPYLGVDVVLRALRATGGDTTPEKIRQAVLALDFENPEGRISFDPQTRFAIRDIYIGQITKRGENYIVLPVHAYKEVPPRGF